MNYRCTISVGCTILLLQSVMGLDCQAQTVTGRVLLTNSSGLVQGDAPVAWVVLCRENRILKKQDKLSDKARFELEKEADARAFDLIVGAPDMTPATYRGLVAESGEKLVLTVTLQKMSETLLAGKHGRKMIDRKVADALELLPAGSDEARSIRESVERLDQKRPITVLLPAYFYPGGNTAREWDDVLWASGQLKSEGRLMVIVNVNSGPGNIQQPDQNYLNLISRLASSDAAVIAYVRADYGRRSADEILQDVRRWLGTYQGITGFFFDEVSPEKKDVAHFKALCEATRKLLKGVKQPLVIGNFGRMCDEGYAASGVFDLLCISESRWGDQKIERPSWDRKDSKAKFGEIIYGVNDQKEFGAAFVLATSEGCSFVYITDQRGMGNEVLWTRLPNNNEIWRPLIQKVKTWNKSAKSKK